MSFVIDRCSRHALKDHPERDTAKMVYKFNPVLRKSCRYKKDLRAVNCFDVRINLNGIEWALKIAAIKMIGNVVHGELITAYPID